MHITFLTIKANIILRIYIYIYIYMGGGLHTLSFSLSLYIYVHIMVGNHFLFRLNRTDDSFQPII